jgi:hypothetical protein
MSINPVYIFLSVCLELMAAREGKRRRKSAGDDWRERVRQGGVSQKIFSTKQGIVLSEREKKQQYKSIIID